MAYKAQDFIDAIPGTGGLYTKIAAKVECDWRTVRKFVTEYSTVRKAFEQEREAVKDVMENHIIEAGKDGDLAICKWYLTTQGRDRGYGDTPQVEINQYPITVEQWKTSVRQRLNEIEDL